MIDVSRFVETLGGRPVAVFGLGLSNMAAIRALAAAGAEIWAWDDHEMRRDDAARAGAVLRNPMDYDMGLCACLVLAPGVPLHFPDPHPVVARARAAGREIICDLEVLHRCEHGRRVIGITGTNGKSTTTALAGFILNECGVPAAVGGNIGVAALALDMPPEGGAFVLEISSYQMDLCPSFAPDIAVHLNLTPDHLDRHGSMENYMQAKLALFRGAGDAVIATDDDYSRRMAEAVGSAGVRAAYPVSVMRAVEDGVCVRDSLLYDRLDGGEDDPYDLGAAAALPGVHNHQNAAAAYAIARLCGCAGDAAYEAIRRFPGLPHRLFTVRTINGIPYVNDSKATNAAATARALACYRNIYWIAGGLPKDGGLDGLEPFMDRIAHVFLIGQAERDFAEWLRRRDVPHSSCGTLERAVAAAHGMAQSGRGRPGGGGVVLLSPACASFDQFSNFEERGDLFARLAGTLKEDAS